MNSENYELKNFSHKIGQNWYHVVLVPKYRYPVFANKLQHELMQAALIDTCKRHSIDLYEHEIMSDHVHIFISCPPSFSIRKLIHVIKGATSYYIRSNHKPLRRYKSLWNTGAMYRSVGNVSAETIKRYIAESNNWIDDNQKKLV